MLIIGTGMTNLKQINIKQTIYKTKTISSTNIIILYVSIMQISNKFTAFNCSRIWFNCSVNFRILFFRFWRVIFFILLILWRVVLFPEFGMLSSFLTIDEMVFLYLLSSVFLKARAVYELIDFRNNFDNLYKKTY